MTETDLVAWIREQLDIDERIAIAASSCTHGSTPGGEYWRWENEVTDQPVTPQPGIDEYLTPDDDGPLGLRSVENYPIDEWGERNGLPHFVVRGQDEIRTVDALHIARHDPAAVIADVGAKRRILDEIAIPNLIDDQTDETAAHLVRLLAAAYASRPGYRGEWAPTDW